MSEARPVWPGSTQLSPVPAALVGVGGGASGFAPNLLTVAWCGIACSKPPMLTVAIKPERHSYGILRATGEFTVNLPAAALVRAVDLCGVISGRDQDKFAAAGLTALAAERVQAPLVAECPLGLECRVAQMFELGSHHLFLADIVAVRPDPAYLTDSGRLDLTRDGLLGFAHGHYYNLGECLGHFGFAVRRKPGPRVRH